MAFCREQVQNTSQETEHKAFLILTWPKLLGQSSTSLTQTPALFVQ